MLIRWWNQNSDCKINLEGWDVEHLLLFGIPIKEESFKTLNLIILQSKISIHLAKKQNKNICLLDFIRSLKSKLKMYRTILKKNKKMLNILKK